MNPSIPAAPFVNVIPSVLAAGAADLAMDEVFVDNSGDTSIPIGTVQEFGSSAEVAAWYGASSLQANLAGIYFAGYNGGTALPAALFFVQQPTAAVAAYLRGGSLADVTLADLQELSGSIEMEIDGVGIQSGNINLSSATSYSNAAALIQAGLQVTGNVFNGTATVTNTSTTVTINSTVSGQLHVGDNLVGTDIPSGATIESFGTYNPGAGTGTVVISAAATGNAGPETVTVTIVPTCTYDALRHAFVIQSGTTGSTSSVGYPTTASFTTGTLLTQAKGAVLSQGSAALTPAEVMDSVVADTQDWASFQTVIDPDEGEAGGPIKVEFATWTAEQDAKYAYIAYDSDPAAAEGADGSCFAKAVSALVGTIPIWSATQGAQVAAFMGGFIASINFNATGGRTTAAYRSSPAITPDVTDLDTYLNLKGNGYNAYLDVATRTTAFQWFQPGQISGDWAWIDPYVNQIFWNSRFQNDFAELLTQVPDIPYTQAGYNMIREALSPDIQAMGAFGAWKAGVALSGSQQVAVNTAAGINIAGILSTQGWYLQVEDPGATVRAARGSPDVTFWYTDGGAVQQINMASIDVE